MKQFAALLVFLCSINFCTGQSVTDSVAIISADIDEGKTLKGLTYLYVDSNSSLSIDQVLQKPFHAFENSPYADRLEPEMIKYTFYLKVYLPVDTLSGITGYFYPGRYFKYCELFKTEGKVELIPGNNQYPGFTLVSFKAGEPGVLLVRLKPLKNEFNNINPQLISVDFIDSFTIHRKEYKSDIQVFGLVLSGILLMMILFMITNYIVSKKLEFLYNAAYSLCMFLLIYLNSTLYKSSSKLASLYYSYLDFFLLVVGVLFYITFTRKFLNTKKNDPLLEKVLKYGEHFVLLLLVVYTYLNFFTSTYLPQNYLETFMKIFILAIGCAFIFLAFKRRQRLFSYIAAGNAMLVFFSVISLALVILHVKPTKIYSSSLFYYNTGIVLELVFFLLGLTYKNRSELIKGIKEQEALKLEAEKTVYETQIAVMKAQQEERNRISADMHDDLGAGMTTISLYSELAKSKLKNNPLPEIEKISTSANELLNKMNAIIWSMSSSNDSLSNLIAYIRSYAQEYFEDTGIVCKIEIVENLPNIEVNGELRRNVFLVVKEALNNILKHAQATKVHIKLIRVENSLTLYIQDNGKGIDFDSIRQFGNGLRNMKKRMLDIGVDFNIENKNGTLITMHRKVKSF